MATALVRGMQEEGWAPIFVYDRIPAAMEALADNVNVFTVNSAAELAEKAEVLLLCVKPKDAPEALSSLKKALAGKLVISIVAGLTLERMESLAPDARFVRVMPNTPALIHKGMAAFAVGSAATEDDVMLTSFIFTTVGEVEGVDESRMDAVTGLSGSGPAYIYFVIEALTEGGVKMGLERELALRLAVQTVLGATQMFIETGQEPAELINQVTSPGGTTLAGLEVLKNAGVKDAFINAVRAATERSRELGA